MSISIRLVLIGLASVALGLCSTAWAQAPAAGDKPAQAAPKRAAVFAPPTSILAPVYSVLLPMPTVQKELNLSEDQQSKVKEIIDKDREALSKLVASVRDLSPEERQAKLGELREKMEAKAEETKKAIEGILLPKQLQRLKGLALQMAGGSAVMDKEIQQNLKLSDDQVAKIKLAHEDLTDKANKVAAGVYALSPADRQAKMVEVTQKMQQIRADFEKQIMGVLTADQKASIEKMKGEKFEFPASVGGAPPAAKRPAGSK